MAGTRELKQKLGDLAGDVLPRVGRRVGDATHGRSARQRDGVDDIETRSRDTDERLAARYASGDRRRPGDHPPANPPEGYDPANGVSGWQHRNRGEWRYWMDYEQQIAGTQRVDGRNPEWMQLGPDGRPVAFDGRTLRGQPPVEVFLEAKNGYARLLEGSPRWQQSVADQAIRQLDALPDGAQLEWHVSSVEGANAIQMLFADRGISGISVLYTPKA